MGGFAESLVKAGYRAVAFDAPGHGRTRGNHTTIFRIIEAMQAVVEEVGPLRGILAHSFGGMAVARALRTRLMAVRVVCVSPSAQMRFLVDSFSSTLHLPPRTRKVFEQLLEKDFGADIWTELSADMNAAELSAPALIIHDEDDKEVPSQQGECLAKAWPGARFILTRGLGHRRILYNREIIQTAVNFIVGSD
jgi:pimeloyl-ACP methyl ester carboxylesterase